MSEPLDAQESVFWLAITLAVGVVVGLVAGVSTGFYTIGGLGGVGVGVIGSEIKHQRPGWARGILDRLGGDREGGDVGEEGEGSRSEKD